MRVWENGAPDQELPNDMGFYVNFLYIEHVIEIFDHPVTYCNKMLLTGKQTPQVGVGGKCWDFFLKKL